MTKGTVDEGIHAMAERKLRLDAAVLDGVTAAAEGKAASTTAATVQVHCTPPTCKANVPLFLSRGSVAEVPLKEGGRFEFPADLILKKAETQGVPTESCYAWACFSTLLATGNPKASPNLLADLMGECCR